MHAINLTLVNVTSEDNGFTLTCIAENVVGMSNASVALTVHCEWLPSWRGAVYRRSCRRREAGAGVLGGQDQASQSLAVTPDSVSPSLRRWYACNSSTLQDTPTLAPVCLLFTP